MVVGRSINIHKHLAMLQEATGWEDMRYEEAFVGGQFGIKIDVTSEGLTAAAAIHFRRPVRYIPSLVESMYLSPKRHPFDMRLKLAADADGKLTAMGWDILVDNGAYNSMGNVVMLRAIQMLSGSYDIPNVDALARLVYTNNPWGAAARGAGPPQTHYALESALDLLAAWSKPTPRSEPLPGAGATTWPKRPLATSMPLGDSLRSCSTHPILPESSLPPTQPTRSTSRSRAWCVRVTTSSRAGSSTTLCCARGGTCASAD